MVTLILQLAVGIAAAVAALIKVPSPKVVWAAPLAFLGGLAAAFIIWLLSVGAISLTVNMKKKYKTPSVFFRGLINSIYDYICVLCGVRVKVSGLEKIPDGKFTLVANHCSSCDNMIIGMKLPHIDTAFISKPENFKIPIVRRLITRQCFLPIDRDNAKNALRTINEGAELVKSGSVSMGVFPEGTRSKMGEMGEFRYGCFRMAQRAESPLVIMSLTGTDRIKKNAPFKRTDVFLDILHVFQPEELNAMRTVEISALAREMMEERIKQRRAASVKA